MKRLVPFLTVFVPVAVVYLVGGFESPERSRMDLGFRLAERESRAGIVIVEIDPRSLQTLGIWPWPRGYHATVLENLFAAGARRVGFDIDFSSRSVSSDEDRELARALAAAPERVVLPVFGQWQEAASGSRHLAVAEPLPQLGRNATLASINVRPESDGLVRRYANRQHLGGRALPAFAAALAGDPRPDIESFYIDFGISSRSVPRVSFVDVLTGRFDPSRVRDKVAIVGPTAVELGDQLAVPVAAALPGPILQAMAFESLVQGRALDRQGPVVSLIGALVLTLGLAPVLGRASWRRGLAIAISTAVGLLLAAGVVETRLPILLDVVPWVVTTLGLYGLAVVRRVDQQALGLLRQRVAIRRNESVMRHIVEKSFDAIVTLDDDGLVATFNRSAEAMFGYGESEARGLRLAELISAEGNSAGSWLADAAEGPTEARGRSRDGRVFPVEIVVTTIDAADETRLVAVIRDITERHAHQEELRHRATHDRLTRLPNRVLLLERMEALLEKTAREKGSATLMLLDLDGFKEINDALGHAVGDRLLQAVAKRLEVSVREQDTLARLGGDEFAVLLPDTTVEPAQRIARALIAVLKNPIRIDDFTLHVDTSLGIALYPEHGKDVETLVQRADVAMYVAKDKRAGLVVYGPEQDFNHVRRLTIRGELGNAIEQGLLKLVYQPKVERGTGRIVGVEALLRWDHPRHGFIPPDEFTGIAEHSGLIHPLTQWVLDTALAQASQWRRDGYPLMISVNLSAQNLLEQDLPVRIERMLSRHGFAPRDLTLEITESMLMDDPERALANMGRLRALDLNISVDDFGTGYSSLEYLTRLPANELKIDKSFVMRIHDDPATATVVRSTIELAHDLGMKVVAEGVESEEVWEDLQRFGCDLGQGYHFSPPIPPGEVRDLLDGSEVCVSAAHESRTDVPVDR